MEKYNLLIIGGGSIGALKPDKFDSPETKNILTHAHAGYCHPNINLLGVIEKDKEKREKIEKKWSCRTWESINDYDDKAPDIITIAVDTNYHYDLIKKCRENFKSFLFIEKPCCNSLEEINKIKDLENCAINYTRRYEEVFELFCNKIKYGEYNKIYGSIFKYVRGLKRDGCHAIDLMTWMFGDLEELIYTKKGYSDLSEEDTTDSALLKFKNNDNCLLFGCDGRKYDVFEMEIITEDGIISTINHGHIFLQRVKMDDLIYGNYSSISNPVEMKTELGTALLKAYDNIIKYLEMDFPLKCTIEDAIRVHKIIELIKFDLEGVKNVGY